MKVRLIKNVLTVLTLLSLAACSSSDDDDGGINEVSGSSEIAAFIGEWSTGCVASLLPETPVTTFFTYQFRIDQSTWVSTISSYLDESCTSQFQSSDDVTSIRGDITITADYTDEGQVTTSDGLLANSLLSNITSIESTLDEEGEDSTTDGTLSVLVYVSEEDSLFIDETVLGFSETSRLLLTLPFNRVE